MKSYTINVVSLKVEETKLEKGLAFNSKGMIYGITVKTDNQDSAMQELYAAEQRWREWITKYNVWITEQI